MPGIAQVPARSGESTMAVSGWVGVWWSFFLTFGVEMMLKSLRKLKDPLGLPDPRKGWWSDQALVVLSGKA